MTLSSAFDAFIRKVANKEIVLLISDGRNRYFLVGRLGDLYDKSLVVVERQNDAPWIVPRHNIVAWYRSERGYQELLEALTKQGWTAPTTQL